MCHRHSIKYMLTDRYTQFIPIWPGTIFSTLEDREVIEALLDTPKGSGTAWLLAQPREQVGWETVDKFFLFYVEG
jgi:hypothetical protein